MFRVIDVEESPLVPWGPPDEYGGPSEYVLPPTIRALPDAVVTIIESAGEGAAITGCACGTRVGYVLAERDDGSEEGYWGAYSVWGDGDGLYRLLCEECSGEEAAAVRREQ